MFDYGLERAKIGFVLPRRMDSTRDTAMEIEQEGKRDRVALFSRIECLLRGFRRV